MITPDTLIFDLDGTLIDTLEDLADAGNDTLNRFGLKALPVDHYRFLVGAGAQNLIRRCLITADPSIEPTEKQVEQMVAVFKQRYQAHWHDKSRPYPGMPSLIASLAQAGRKLAILSNKPDPFTRSVVDHYFPEQPFQAVLGQRADVPLKPDPAGALLLCRQLSSTPERTALIGDSGSDMETAVRAGMLPLGVLWGFREADELQAGGATELFATAEALTERLLGQEAADSVQSG